MDPSHHRGTGSARPPPKAAQGWEAATLFHRREGGVSVCVWCCCWAGGEALLNSAKAFYLEDEVHEIQQTGLLILGTEIKYLEADS